MGSLLLSLLLLVQLQLLLFVKTADKQPTTKQVVVLAHVVNNSVTLKWVLLLVQTWVAPLCVERTSKSLATVTQSPHQSLTAVQVARRTTSTSYQRYLNHSVSHNPKVLLKYLSPYNR